MAQVDQTSPDIGRTVFVVHGRNQTARDSMFQFLRALGLQPLEWDQAVALTKKGSPYVGEVLDAAFTNGQAIVVLLTPDDVAYLHSDYAVGLNDPETDARGQARPNVLFEAGMAMGRNADHTILVELGSIRPFSDIGGRHAIRLDDSAEKRQSLATRLATAGLPVDRSRSDWLKVGDFSPPTPGNSLPLGKRVPQSDRRGPSVDGHWSTSGSNQFDKVTITNGPIDLYDVAVEVPSDARGVQLMDVPSPLKKLPAFKTFTFRGSTDTHTMGPRGDTQFELKVTARLADDTAFEQMVWFDAGR